ncbi:MAG: thiamine pyrophosphate-dependent dehydrogenase E1 component subunit alpha [Chlamydiae bacterium]|nr:thiamine pyrophosphate-dependent dehydrogenase E1 component subunit alpha [Chlamydiota bacterium]
MEVQILKKLYYQMLRIRKVEERIAELYPEQQIRCPVHLCIGQEAVSVGICAHLKSEDYVMSGHRSHGHYLGKGGDLSAMMAELYGKVTGCSRGKGGSMHLVDLSVGFLGATPIVASTIPMGVGAALGAVMKGEKRISVVFFGEGATEEGAFQESVNFAVLKKLPVIFVCENNFYSVYSPLSVRQPVGREVVEQARGYGLESFQGDGNDVKEVYRLGGEAAERARRGEGPTFLEFKTYRWREHCGPNYDNDLGYRSEEEFEQWKKICPLSRLQSELLLQKWVDEVELQKIARELDEEIEETVAFAKKSPFPEASELMEHVYAQ